MDTIAQVMEIAGSPPRDRLTLTQRLFGMRNGLWGGIVHKDVCWWNARRLHNGAEKNYLVAPQAFRADGTVAVRICAHGVNQGSPLVGKTYAALRSELVAVQVHGVGLPRSQ